MIFPRWYTQPLYIVCRVYSIEYIVNPQFMIDDCEMTFQCPKHDDVMTWIRSVDTDGFLLNKGQWHTALMFYLVGSLQIIKQTVELADIWDTTTFMWRHPNDTMTLMKRFHSIQDGTGKQMTQGIFISDIYALC